jgi:hypothetical protein
LDDLGGSLEREREREGGLQGEGGWGSTEVSGGESRASREVDLARLHSGLVGVDEDLGASSGGQESWGLGERERALAEEDREAPPWDLERPRLRSGETPNLDSLASFWLVAKLFSGATTVCPPSFSTTIAGADIPVLGVIAIVSVVAVVVVVVVALVSFVGGVITFVGIGAGVVLGSVVEEELGAAMGGAVLKRLALPSCFC